MKEKKIVLNRFAKCVSHKHYACVYKIKTVYTKICKPSPDVKMYMLRGKVFSVKNSLQLLRKDYCQTIKTFYGCLIGNVY